MPMKWQGIQLKAWENKQNERAAFCIQRRSLCKLKVWLLN